MSIEVQRVKLCLIAMADVLEYCDGCLCVVDRLVTHHQAHRPMSPDSQHVTRLTTSVEWHRQRCQCRQRPTHRLSLWSLITPSSTSIRSRQRSFFVIQLISSLSSVT